VLPAQKPMPARIMGDLLAGHPEAASLLGEARHCQALAACSAATAGQAFTAAQAARLCYEELRHRLDPRRRRPVNFGAGLGLLAGMGAALAVLDGVELGGLQAGMPTAPVVMAATAVWLTGAWLAALASRERRRVLVTAITVGAIGLGILLTALHCLNARPGGPTPWGHVRVDIAVGVVAGVLLVVLAVGTAVLMACMEPASVLVARRRWLQARAEHQAAVRLEHADAEAASITGGAWLGLVRARACTVEGESSAQVVEESLALASALQQTGRPPLRAP
jgi:hypothetical protein